MKAGILGERVFHALRRGAGLDIDGHRPLGLIAEGHAEGHDYQDREAIDPEDGLGLAIEFAQAGEDDLHEWIAVQRVARLSGRLFHRGASSSLMCRPARCTKTSSRLACRVVRLASASPRASNVANSAGKARCGSATERQ